MPLVSKYKMPKLSWNWISEADLLPTGSINLPSGVRVGMLPRRANIQNSVYGQLGVTHLYQNLGQPDNSIVFGNKAIFDNCESVFAACGGGDPRTWQRAQVEAAANAIQSPTQAQFIIEELGEKVNIQTRGDGRDYGAGLNQGIPINVWNASEQCEWFVDRFQSRCAANGTTFYLGYDGIEDIGVLMFNNHQAIRDALSSNSVAYTTAQNYTGFGNLYFAKGKGATMGGVIKAYATGDDNRARYVSKHLCQMKIVKRAKAHVGWTTRVAMVYWPGYDERPTSKGHNGYQYKRVVPAGGTITGATVPIWGIPAQVFLHAAGLLEGYDLFDWEIAFRLGSNPAVTPFASPPEVTTSGNMGTQADPAYVYTTGNVGYPFFPSGVYDIGLVAINLVSWMRNHAASAPAYAAISINGGTASGSGTSYPIDQFSGGQKVFGLYTSQGNNRSLLVWDGNGPGTRRTITADCGGTTHTFESSGGGMYAARLTV
jgi:hypothetical protein